jgi:hypothetical protein
VDLRAFDVVVVTCRTPGCRMAPHRDRLRRYLNGGGTLVAMGETEPGRWLDGICFTAVPTNYWWWLEPGADLGPQTLQPAHDLWRHLPPQHVVWHYHGHFAPPTGASTLITCREGGAVLYEDAVSTDGRLILTSLDPFYHHGTYFMPAATRFLDGLLACSGTARFAASGSGPPAGRCFGRTAADRKSWCEGTTAGLRRFSGRVRTSRGRSCDD